MLLLASIAALNSVADLNWAVFASAGTVLVLVVAFFRWVRPRVTRTSRDIVAARDSLLGRDEVRDSITGTVTQEALPGIGVRMANNEKQMEVITQAVAKIADSHARLDALADGQADLGERVSKLEQATVERIVNRAESTAAYRAIEALATKDVLDSDPE